MQNLLLQVSALVVCVLAVPFAAPLVLAGDLPAQETTPPTTKPTKSAKPKRVCTLSPPSGGSAIPKRNCHTEYPPEEQVEAPTTDAAGAQGSEDTASTEQSESTGGG